MDRHFSKPLSIENVRINDAFWQREMGLIRSAVIPYQWEALHDRVPGAAPSWWAHNMRAAARSIAARKAGKPYTPHPTEHFENLPEDPEKADPDTFYGFVFQDSDGYKWLEAAAYQLSLRENPELLAQAQEAVDMICAAQEEDGYLDTYYTLTGRDRAFTNLKDHHELYCFGHMTEAAVAWRQATGREDLLNAVKRFARCISSRFGPGLKRGCPGHEIAEMALLRLYEETGEKEWLDLATFFLDVRGTDPNTFALEENERRKNQGLSPLPVEGGRYAYYQAHMPVRRMKEAVGHAVRQMYLCSGMADAARINRDPEMEKACRRLWDSVVREKMYVTGGVGGTHVGEAFSRPFDLPSDTAYSETCAAVGLVFFARRMLQLEPRAEYADVMEKALYNTVLAGMALDGQSFFYVNPLEVDPGACETDERLRHVHPVRQKWFGCACCPPKIARLVSSLGQYICTGTEDTLYIHLYVGSEIKAEWNGRALTLRLDADLARDGKVTVTVISGEGEGTIALRRPGWADGGDIRYPEGAAVREVNGYCLIHHEWKSGDTIRADFPMPVQVLAASPRVRETAGQVCFVRGPFVYCAEEKDNGKDLHLLRASPERVGEAAVEALSIGGFSLPALKIPGKRVSPQDGSPLYAPWQKEETRDTSILLVPYFAWNNRGEGEMRVWLRAESK